MIYFLRGNVFQILDSKVIIDVQGVGYEVLVIHPNDFVVGEETMIYTLHIVKEDEEFLVGFRFIEEKEVFEQLISVKGIGPKTALSALSEISIDDFKNAVLTQNLKVLTKLPGIGKKAASQIILDLAGKLSISNENTKTNPKLNANQEEAKIALKSLGFKDKEVESVLLSIEGENISTKAYVTEALRRIRK